jgi:hypothetical protein
MSPQQTLTDEQVREVLALTSEADSVELKLTIPQEMRFSVAQALGVDPLDGRLRQIFFFDTPDLRLDASGVVVRARRTQDRPDDSVVKLRPVVPSDLDAELREREEFGVEVDAMPGGFVCSASFKHKLDEPRVREIGLEQAPISKAFSKHQRRFFAEHAPDGLELDDLSILGPIPIIKVKFTPDGFKRRLTGELWNYPDGSQIAELSTKCEPGEGFQVAAELRGLLSERGIDIGGEQQTKTRAALEYFSSQ